MESRELYVPRTTHSFVVSLLIALGSVGSVSGQGIHFDLPSSGQYRVVSESIGNQRVDLIYPLPMQSSPRAAVVFVFGFPDGATSFGPLVDYEFYRDWARIVTMKGLVGVLYSTTDPLSDLRDVVDFIHSEGPRLGIDAGRVALWSASANAPTALHYVRTEPRRMPRALVVYYGLMPTPDGFQAEALQTGSSRSGFALPAYAPDHAYPQDLPILVVRAGRDASAPLLASIDHFVEFALADNLRLRLLNYPEGQHSFDSRDDTEETRAVITETLAFLSRHLNN